MVRMRFCLLATLIAFLGLAAGCSRQVPAPAPEERPVAGGNAPTPVPVQSALNVAAPAGPGVTQPQEKYEAALQDAIGLLGEGKLTDALASLQAAKGFRDTEFVRAEIAKLQMRLDQQAGADRTVQDVQAVLDQGKADEAAGLAAKGLAQYGDGAAAGPLSRLKLQADALTALSLKDNPDRFQRFRAEGQAALGEKNLRAAALAFEQALQYGQDTSLRQQLGDLQSSLARYDDSRRQAAELRRDPQRLEEAVALLQEAAKAWDTLQVRQEIDEYSLALQKRRDRVAVADFEVRGDVGLAAAGRTIAEELLPPLRPRFDVVERGQVDRVLDELKLESTQLASSPTDQREVGRLANVRYLVVGSVTRLGGLVVNARLVEARTGLVVQTAKVTAPTPEELLLLLPELARLLLMTDEERIRYEQQQVQVAQAIPPQVVDETLPPAPEEFIAGQPLPPPVVIVSSRPPELGGVRPEDFDRLPAALVVTAGPAPVVVVEAERNHPVRGRLLRACLHLGDNLFRCGRFREAHFQFNLALNLAPDDVDVRLRLDRCQPHLPPPVVVVAAPPLPRLAILDFVECGEPAVIPPGLGAWGAQQIAPYFCPAYEVVDRGEVFWWMGRLGMTYRDLLNDPAARRWLGRALNVRFFVVGTLRQTASFDATTNLLDAETGFVYGAGRIHVQDPWELKLRLGELTRLTTLPPDRRPLYERDGERVNELVVKARLRTRNGEFSLAIGLFQDALRVRPDDVQVLALLQQNEMQARQAQWEEARRREFERTRAEAEACRRRQLELAREAEEARRRAAEAYAALSAEQRYSWEAERRRRQELTQGQLLVQARVALQVGNFGLSVQIAESAASLRPSDDAFRQLAQARVEADRAARERAAAEAAARQAELARRQTAELSAARQRLDGERRQRMAEEQARRQAQEQRDQVAYQGLFDQGQRFLGKEQYEEAANAFQAARRMKKTDAVEAMLSQALVGQARAAAQAKGQAARQVLERQLAEEKGRRAAAEALAQKNQQLYLQALRSAQQALASQRYDEAATRFQEAGKVYQTDVVLTGLKQAEAGRAQVRTAALAVAQKKTEEAQRSSARQRLTAQGRLALEAKQYSKAIEAFGQAKKLAPTDVEVLAGLAKAEQAQAQSTAEARRQDQEQQRQQDFRRLLDGGKANLAARKYDAAILSLNEALKLKPGDPGALQARADAEAAQKASGTPVPPVAAANQAAYQKALSTGRVALSAKQYDAAIQAFTDAQRVLPGDRASADFLRQAQQGKQAALAVAQAQAKQRAAELERQAQQNKALQQARADAQKVADAAAKAQQVQADARRAQDLEAARQAADQKRKKDFTQFVASGQASLGQKHYDAAVQAFQAALRLVPNDPATTRLLQQATAAQRAANAPPPVKITPPAAPPLKNPPPTPPSKTPAPPLVQNPPPSSLVKPTPPAAPPVRQVQANYLRQMQAGAALDGQKKFAEAMKAYQEALRLVPGDIRATAALRGAEVSLHLDLGQKALQAGRTAEAAREFDAALRLDPNNREAQAGVRRTRKKTP